MNFRDIALKAVELPDEITTFHVNFNRVDWALETEHGFYFNTEGITWFVTNDQKNTVLKPMEVKNVTR